MLLQSLSSAIEAGASETSRTGFYGRNQAEPRDGAAMSSPWKGCIPRLRLRICPDTTC